MKPVQMKSSGKKVTGANEIRCPKRRRSSLRSIIQLKEASKHLPPKSSSVQQQTLPHKYEILAQFFDSMVFSIQRLGIKTSSPLLFSNITPMVHAITNRKFTYNHLAHLKLILPDAIVIEEIIVSRTPLIKRDLRVSLNFSVIRNHHDDTITLNPPSLYECVLMRKLFRSRLFQSKHNKDARIPLPAVSIDKESDSDATVVQVTFDCCLGALFETMKILNYLAFDVVKQTITAQRSVVETKFHVTQLSNGRKIEDPDLLKYIRLAILNNLLKYHTSVEESRSRLAMGKACGIQAPVKEVDVYISTHMHVNGGGPKRSFLNIETEDSPGLLLEVVKTRNDATIHMESAEGLVAQNKLNVCYMGTTLNESLSQVLRSCLSLQQLDANGDNY